MPGSQHGPSIKNPRVYDALRRKGMSKRRAAAISNAQRQKESGVAGLAIPPTGPHALFNNPGVGIRSARRRKRLKGWDAKVGQTIIGNLVRGEGGRFSGGGNSSASRKPSARSDRAKQRQARADERRARYAEEDAQEQATRAEEDAYIAAGANGRERQRRRAEIAAKRRERANVRRARRAEDAAMEREQRGEEDAADAKTEEEAKPKGGGGGGGSKKKPTEEEKRADSDRKKAENRRNTAPKAGLKPDEAEALKSAAEGGQVDEAQIDNLAELGLVQAGENGFEATDAGRRVLAALERGDVRGALAAIQDGKAKMARDAARHQPKLPKKPLPTPGRGGQKPGQGSPGQRVPGQRPAPRPPVSTMPVRPDPAIARERSRALAQRAIRNLEERRQRRSRSRNRGIGGITNVERSNRTQRKAEGWREKSQGALTIQPGPISATMSKLTRGRILEAQRGHDAYSSSTSVTTKSQSAPPANNAPQSRQSNRDVSTVRNSMPESIPPTFTVFKNAAGHDRWASITTTAYQDKDKEWISRKAIRAVVAAGDSGAPRGPLRFWHVPGLDLGDCDYQAALGDGRLLLESGTFRSKAAARIGAEAARRGYQMSPGFVHTRQEPCRGVFDNIALFERSFVPPGRASNPYTRLLTKERRMLTDEKRKEFEELAGDTEGRALLQQLLSQAETTTKAADQAGAVYKDAPPWAQALIARLDALETTVKAPMSPAEMMEAGDTEAADGLAELEAETMADDMDEPMDDASFAKMIAQEVIGAFRAEIVPLLELEKKMAGWASEIKAGLPQMQQQMTQKDDARAKEIEVLRAANTALETRLKALEGDQPRGSRSLHAGVWGDLTGIPVTKEQAAVLTTQQPGQQVPAGLASPAEVDAYKLIFGNE